MHIVNINRINAPAAQVWDAIADIATWPGWTKSVTSVTVLGEPPFAIGTAAEVKQPGMPRAVWTVTELTEGASFTWQARNRGLVSIGGHAVRDLGDGSCEVTLVFDQRGPLAGVMALLFGRKSRRFVQMEGDGLRVHSEAVTMGPSAQN